MRARTLSPPGVAESRSSLLVLAVKSGNIPPEGSFTNVDASASLGATRTFRYGTVTTANPFRVCATHRTLLYRSISGWIFPRQGCAVSRRTMKVRTMSDRALRQRRDECESLAWDNALSRSCRNYIAYVRPLSNEFFAILVNVSAPFIQAALEAPWTHGRVVTAVPHLPLSNSIVFIATSDVGVRAILRNTSISVPSALCRPYRGPNGGREEGKEWRTMSWTCNEFSIVLYEPDDNATVRAAMPPCIVTWLTLSWPARYVVNCYHLRSKAFIYRRLKNVYCTAHREVSNAPQ